MEEFWEAASCIKAGGQESEDACVKTRQPGNFAVGGRELGCDKI